MGRQLTRAAGSKGRDRVSEVKRWPSISIVIPVRNEVETIAATLESCLDQTYSGSLEIVVADAQSDDGTRQIVQKYAAEHAVRLVPNPAQITPAGLNAAIAASTGEVIVRCDAHSVLPPRYVETAVEILEHTDAGNVGGVQRAVGVHPMQRGIACAMTNPLGVGDARFHRGGSPGEVDTVYLGVFRRSVLADVGGFDEALERNQDYELNIRIRNAGHTVWFDPNLEVVYVPRNSLSSLWRQYHDYGKWKRRVVGMHPSSMRSRQAAPPILVLGLAIAVTLLPSRLRPFGAAVLASYGALLGAAGLYEAARTRDPAGLLAAPAIATMHIAWGTGFLSGSK